MNDRTILLYHEFAVSFELCVCVLYMRNDQTVEGMEDRTWKIKRKEKKIYDVNGTLKERTLKGGANYTKHSYKWASSHEQRWKRNQSNHDVVFLVNTITLIALTFSVFIQMRVHCECECENGRHRRQATSIFVHIHTRTHMGYTILYNADERA